MAWAMQTIGWTEVGNLKKANDYLHKQLSFVTNSFQVNCLSVNFCLRQVNEVNGGDTVFVQCLSVRAQWTGQSDQFKTVKATDFKFDMHVSRDSLDMTP